VGKILVLISVGLARLVLIAAALGLGQIGRGSLEGNRCQTTLVNGREDEETLTRLGVELAAEYLTRPPEGEA
jgi:hypothetical protein